MQLDQNYIGCVWKPSGVSSFQVLGNLKKLFNTKKVGHMGTLDVLAEGILPFAVGQYTKLIPYLNLVPKIYKVEITFGVTSPSIDAEYVTEEMLEEAKSMNDLKEMDLGEFSKKILLFLEGQIGEIDQMPPQFSALKVNGVRSYDMARKGLEVELKARRVDCFGIELNWVKWEDGLLKAGLKIECGSGYYVRSLVRDLCNSVQVDGFMSFLAREKVGCFDKCSCVDFEQENISFKKFCWDDLLGGQKKIVLDKSMYESAQKGLSVYHDVTDELNLGDIVLGMYGDGLSSVFEVSDFHGRKFLKVKNNFEVK